MIENVEQASGILLDDAASLSPGEMRAYDIPGLPPLALFNVAGELFATGNVCTHNVAILTDGSFEGNIVECPLHGGAFDVRTGEAVSYPCEKAIDCFRVKKEGERVFVIPEIAQVRASDESVKTTIAHSPVVSKSAETRVAGRVDRKIWIDGREAPFVCAAGDTILRSALRNGIGFPYECNSGGCGSCVFETVSGETTDLSGESSGATGLSAAARSQGRRLGCQALPLTDCIIKVKQADSFIPIEPPRVRTATLRSIISLTHDMAAFTFESDGPADFLPGQYALLRKRDGQVERAYSMSNTRNEAGLWEFVIKQVPGGKFSTDIAAQLDISDGMVLDGPYGNAYLQVDSTRPVLCIAGGAGLSPMLSILRGAIRDNRFKERPLSLFYGARTPMDLCDATVLEDHVVLGQRVQWVNALSDAAPVGNKPWDGPTGFIHTVVAAQLANNLTNFEIYLSGPPPMTDAVQRMLLLDYRVPSQQIHFDRFY